MFKATISSDAQVVVPKADWRSMRGMAQGEESLTQALEAEHRDELAREDAELESN